MKTIRIPVPKAPERKNMPPTSRVHRNRKKYNRSLEKRKFRKEDMNAR